MALSFLRRRPSERERSLGNRLPPGQYLTEKWPVLHYGSMPRVDLATWDFRIDGLVRQPRQAGRQSRHRRPRGGPWRRTRLGVAGARGTRRTRAVRRSGGVVGPSTDAGPLALDGHVDAHARLFHAWRGFHRDTRIVTARTLRRSVRSAVWCPRAARGQRLRWLHATPRRAGHPAL